MFSNQYILVLAEILLFIKITDVHNYQDSRYINDSYYNTSHSLRRFERQTGGECLIPHRPLHTRYEPETKYKSRYTYGDYLPNYATLITTCSEGYKLHPFSQTHSICIGGIWNPPLSMCHRACPSLQSIESTTVKCQHDLKPLANCHNAIEGTTLEVSCNVLYEDMQTDSYPSHFCSNGRWQPPLPQCQPVCGQKRPLGTENIINGIDTLLGDYPWHVGIYNATDKSYLCGGSIIVDRNIVVSAAHCFSDYDGTVFPKDSFMVAAGKYYRSYSHSDDKNYAQYSKIRHLNIHDRYKGSSTLQAFDIAILVLETPFSLSYAVQPVCIELYKILQPLHLSSDSVGVVVGWGYTRSGQDLADVLQELDTPFIPYDQCYSELPVNFKPFLNQDKICGGYKNSGTSVCTGDSGGGFFFNNRINDRYYIKGIVSTSPATISQQCDSDQYSLFTSTAIHINFIRRVILRNRLYEDVECKYDRCAAEKPKDVPEEEEEPDRRIEIPYRPPITPRPYTPPPIDRNCGYFPNSCKGKMSNRSLFKRMVEAIL